MSPRYRLLIVDDEPRMCKILSIAAQKWGYEVRTEENGQKAIELIESFHPEIVVTDIKMPVMDGQTLLERIRAGNPNTQVVLMTAYGSVKGAVDAIKAGAFDYILKPFDNEELRVTIARAAEMLQLRNENSNLRHEFGLRFGAQTIIGGSAAVQGVVDMIERVAPSRANVLVTGESGTGKELVARAIHARSTRAQGPFVAINCAALTSTLLESELFGHEKGAFTGALRTHRGKFEEADGGTIFLDEIGEVDNAFQTKLLRVLQEGTFERVGGNSTLRVDARIVAATNKNLKDEVAAGRFREDLYYRLNVVPIHIPPLRERREDIRELAQHFLLKHARESGGATKLLSADAVEMLRSAPWRGNVRELENTIERAVILSRSNEITADDLWLHPAEFSTQDGRMAPGAGAPSSPRIEDEHMRLPLAAFLDEITKKRVIAALDATGWRKMETAEALGVDRATLYRMIKRFEIRDDGQA